MIDEYKNKEIEDKQYEKWKTKVFKEMETMKRTPYCNAIGALSHLAWLTRLDLQFAMFYHAQYQTDPMKQDGVSVKEAQTPWTMPKKQHQSKEDEDEVFIGTEGGIAFSSLISNVNKWRRCRKIQKIY